MRLKSQKDGLIIARNRSQAVPHNHTSQVSANSSQSTLIMWQGRASASVLQRRNYGGEGSSLSWAVPISTNLGGSRRSVRVAFSELCEPRRFAYVVVLPRVLNRLS